MSGSMADDLKDGPYILEKIEPIGIDVTAPIYRDIHQALVDAHAAIWIDVDTEQRVMQNYVPAGGRGFIRTAL